VNRPNEAEYAPSRLSVVHLLLVLGAIVIGLALVFGGSVWRGRAVFRAYVERTLKAPAHPPKGRSIAECVEYAVGWGMACPAMETWCANEAPRVAAACFAAGELDTACEGFGDQVFQTGFGVEACQGLRAEVAGKYAKRSHKKYCASSYRALAELCRERRDAKTTAP